MAINSQNKGKVAERSWALWLRENLEVEARRGFGQSAGGQARPDVESSLPIHWEVKHVNALNLCAAMDQAIRDCRFDNIPVVAHRRDRTPWHITMLASDIERFAKAIYERAKKKNEEEE